MSFNDKSDSLQTASNSIFDTNSTHSPCNMASQGEKKMCSLPKDGDSSEKGNIELWSTA